MFDLPEIVTVWNVTGGSGYAGYSYSEPTPISARTAERFQKVVDRNGADKTSTIAVYFDDEVVKLDSKIFVGESLATEPPQDAYDVIAFAKTPSGTTLRVAYL